MFDLDDTLSFSIHGERGAWKVTITAPGSFTKSDETTERTWYPLFAEMLASACETVYRRRFPERAALSASGAK
jgi:hypothetical protein